MSYVGFKHSEETKALLSARMKEQYANNPESAMSNGKRMRDARQLLRTETCAWCLDSFEAYLGRSKSCDACRPIAYLNTWLQQTYGTSFYAFQELFLAQGGECAICQGSGRKKGAHRIHVDHDHGTGEVRGLLCSDCNLVLGKMQDRADLLWAAAEYLEKHIDTNKKENC